MFGNSIFIYITDQKINSFGHSFNFNDSSAKIILLKILFNKNNFKMIT